VRDWNEDAEPLEWTAIPKEIIAEVKILHRDLKTLLANNAK
jgi:hypothetical protein